MWIEDEPMMNLKWMQRIEKGVLIPGINDQEKKGIFVEKIRPGFRKEHNFGPSCQEGSKLH